MFFEILGRVAALNMLKKPTEFQSVPFFWTVLLGKSIRYTGKMFNEDKKNHYIRVVLTHFKSNIFINLIIKGYGEGYTEIIYKGSIQERKFLAFYIK